MEYAPAALFHPTRPCRRAGGSGRRPPARHSAAPNRAHASRQRAAPGYASGTLPRHADVTTPEQQARAEIDRLLAAAGWAVQDVKAADLHAARGVAIREFQLNPGHGFADYLLYVDGKAAGVIEAKKQGATLTGVEIAVRPLRAGPARQRCRRWRRPLPFVYESTGIETHFTNGLDPEPRARNVFAFHRPETLADWLALPLRHAARAGTGGRRSRRRPSAPTPAPSSPACSAMPPLVTEWGDFKLWPAQITAIRNLEASLAQNKPRALIQMATGCGKTFTAISFIYRLIKFAGARRVLFLVDRGNLGRQTKKEFDQYVSPVQQLQVRRGVHRPAPAPATTSTRPRASASAPSSACTRCSRAASCRKRRTKNPPSASESLFKEPEPIDYNPAFPIETFDIIVTDEAHRSHLQPVAPGAGVLRRLPDRPDRHAQQADLRLLQPEPGDGVRPPAGGGRRRERQLRRLPHQDRGHRGRQPRWKPATGCRCWTSPPAHGATGSSTTTSSTRPKSWTAACRRPTRSAPSPARLRDRCADRPLPAAAGAAQDAGLRQGRQPRRGHRRASCARSWASGNEFAQKITYRTTGSKPEELIKAFRTSYYPRIAVTVDMIATGTDIKPVEIVVFMRSVKSRSFFEQMKGRGVRVIKDDDLRGVNPGEHVHKDHFVIVDCVGVCERDKTDSRPMDQKKSVPLDALLQAVSLGNVEPEVLSSVAVRLARLDAQLTDAERAKVVTRSRRPGPEGTRRAASCRRWTRARTARRRRPRPRCATPSSRCPTPRCAR
ncbi:MAG: DEAD/DEAH box helicase family protein [Comamonadaceae bacterium]|nr:DEAD/DEAH box helicase family protein [Comamonadaceae bacterium]